MEQRADRSSHGRYHVDRRAPAAAAIGIRARRRPLDRGTIAAHRGSTRLDEIRAIEYPEASDTIFLNAASWGLLPMSAAREVSDLILRRNRAAGFEEVEAGSIQHRARSAVARLVGADSSDVALAPNTSFGVNLAASLLRRGPPGRIVLTEGEFPANVLPFRQLESDGFQVVVVPAGADGLPDEQRLLDEIDHPNAVALTVSSVQFATGYRADLPPLINACRSKGLRVFVDAIQSVGVVPIDVSALGADIVACGGQKWLCAPWGSGFAWIRPDVQPAFPPPMVSWLATASGADFNDMLHYRMDWRGNARKFELATLGLQDYLGLARSAEIFAEAGVDAIRAHVLALHEPVLDWIDRTPGARFVTPVDERHRGGILSFVPPSMDRASEALQAAGVVFSIREGVLRLAPHFYNTLPQMHTVVEALDSARR